ncbi:hypothetical protein LSCM1_00170 [Leishmania martiniquensis]|uniref:Uncharacterized protein n=1 Tax=Leishmania martiniquensis TaxID=1580590 RepID=A0A836GS62_9TRYP|nr:hypothetical protein LSCM1_00170 [Leishmania martiniquensis]
MSGWAVAATPPRGKGDGIRGRASGGQGGSSLHAAAAAGTSPRPPPEMPAASSANFAAPLSARQRSKGARGRLLKYTPAASSRSRQSKRTRTVADNGGSAAAAHFSSAGLPFCSTSRGSSAITTTSGRHNPRTSRWACRISEEISLNRMQRAARCFLMHRYLQRTVPVAPDPLSTSESLLDASAAANSVPLLESRFLHRLRATLYREERAEQLRAGIAKRVIEATLSRWAQTRRLQRQHLFLLCRVQAVPEHCLVRASKLERALCGIQASLRMRESSRLAAARRLRLRQQTAARVLERAWQKSPHYAASIRRIHDRQTHDLLRRQEAVERRDLLRRHLVFMVRCHQAFFNDPRMWDAGVAIRRIPLYAPHNLLAEVPYMLSGAAASSPLITGATADSVTLSGDAAAKVQAAASLYRHKKPPLSAAANGNKSSGGWGLPVRACPGTLESAMSSSRADENEGGGRVDIDAALRLGEYRFFFSPAEWGLLAEVKALPLEYLALPLCSDGAEERRTLLDATELRKAEADELAAHPSQLHVMVAGSARNGAHLPNYAQSFVAALTFLRRPRVVDADRRRTAQHLQDLRSRTAEMQQELRTHGYLSATLVAPLLRFGLHYQELAQGNADSSCFTSTAAMKTCRPLVAGRVACAATELRRCLLGAEQGSGDVVESMLSVILEEYRCGFKAAMRTPRQKPSLAALSASALPLPRARPTAGFMRDGFSNPATEALYHPPVNSTRRAGVSHPTSANLAAEGRRRLAVSADDVGPYWHELLVSMVMKAFVTAPGKRGETPGETSMASTANIRSGSALPPGLVRRGIESCLFPGAPSYLLQDFAPPRIQQDAHTRAGTAPLGTASGAVAFAITRAGASPSSLLSTPTYRAGYLREWWDALERLLLQEYADRTKLTCSEAAQRRSIGVLRHMAHSSADKSALEA